MTLRWLYNLSQDEDQVLIELDKRRDFGLWAASSTTFTSAEPVDLPDNLTPSTMTTQLPVVSRLI